MNAAGPLGLVVDDDATARRMLDVRLRALGCQVVLADTGREALTAIECDLPAVILLDLRMPVDARTGVPAAEHRSGSPGIRRRSPGVESVPAPGGPAA